MKHDEKYWLRLTMFGAPQTFILFAANFPTVMVVHRQPSFGFWLWLTLEKVGACLKAVPSANGQYLAAQALRVQEL